jgi:hypothetical protein
VSSDGRVHWENKTQRGPALFYIIIVVVGVVFVLRNSVLKSVDVICLWVLRRRGHLAVVGGIYVPV